MAHRRYHTKTRDGCVQCKQSRIRCDKVRPTCSKCVRKGVICSLADPSSSLIVISTTGSPSKTSPQQHQQSQQEEGKAVSASDGTPTVVNGSNSTPSERTDDYSTSLGGEGGGSSHFTNAERDNLRLMNHYTCHTYRAIASRISATPEEVHLWREYVPKLAFENDYLLHGLLGLSSLHLSLSLPLSQPSSTQQQQQHALLAIRHHNAGIVAFRAQLAHNITVDTIEALFAASCILLLHSFGIYRCRAVPSPLDPIARIHEVLALLRGISVIVRSGFRWLEQSPMSAALMPFPAADPAHQLTAEAQGVLAELSRRIGTTASTSTAVHGDFYAAAIETLGRNLVVATERPDDILAMVLFPVMVPPEFLVLVALREPLALAILANYAVVLHWLRAHIWLEGWGKQVIDAVHEALPEDWRQCTAWAVLETTK